MEAILGEHWWFISGGIALALFAAFRIFSSRNLSPMPANARTFAATHVFTVETLEPFFGTYVPKKRDLMGSALGLAWVTLVGLVLGYILDATVITLAIIGACSAMITFFVIRMETRSMRILGPDRIAYQSPLDRFSWSVPIRSVVQCDLVPGRPHARLRVHTNRGSFTLPLTVELSSALFETAV